MALCILLLIIDRREHGGVARLWDRAANRADQRGRAATQSGDSLPFADAAAAKKVDFRGVGHLGKQSQSEVLLDYEGRAEAARARGKELGAHFGRDWACAQDRGKWRVTLRRRPG